MSQHLELNNGTRIDVPSKLALDLSAQGIEHAFPLSSIQAGMFFHSLFAPDAGLYLEQIILRIDGELNVQQFESSWQRVVDHHEILRTSFRWQDQESPLQVAHRQVTLPFQRLDWRNLTPVEQEKHLESFLAADRRTGFEFAQPPLMRL